MYRILSFILTFMVISIVNARELSFITKISDGSWGYYIGVKDKGPYFYTDSDFLYINEHNFLIKYNLLTKDQTEFKLKSRVPHLYKLDNKIFVFDGDINYEYDNGLIVFDGDIEITSEIFYDFNIGIYKIIDDKKVNILSEDDSDLFPQVSFPKIDEKNRNIYFTVSNDNIEGKLYKYDIKNNELRIIRSYVGDFCLINNNSVLINYYLSNYTHSTHSLYPADLIEIDSNNDIVFNSDEISYSQKHEYIINKFDINSKGDIIAFGAFVDYQNGDSKSYRSVIHLSYK